MRSPEHPRGGGESCPSSAAAESVGGQTDWGRGGDEALQGAPRGDISLNSPPCGATGVADCNIRVPLFSSLLRAAAGTNHCKRRRGRHCHGDNSNSQLHLPCHARRSAAPSSRRIAQPTNTARQRRGADTKPDTPPHILSSLSRRASMSEPPPAPASAPPSATATRPTGAAAAPPATLVPVGNPPRTAEGAAPIIPAVIS